MWKCIKENNNVAFGQNQFDLNVVMDIPYKNLILKCTHDLKGCTTESICLSYRIQLNSVKKDMFLCCYGNSYNYNTS